MIRVILPILIAVVIAASVVWGPRKVWATWKRFGQIVGDNLARAVMTIFYFTLMVPFALITRWSLDPLSQKATASLWRSRSTNPENDVSAAMRQF